METILGRFRNLIVLAAILFAQIVGLAVQVKRPAQQGDTRLIRVWAAAAITPIEKAVINTQNFFYNGWHNYVYLRGVRRENRELRAQLDQMKLEQVRLREDAEMARRIQSLLAFKEQHIDSTVAAQVIGTSGSDQSRVLYIDKGSSDGLRTDMAVITPNGIVGKIVQVFPDSAQVLPVNDQLSGVGVMLQNTRLQGILRGATSGATTIQYVMADERVVPGEDVVTSGGDRIFPKGLPVGKVVEVTPGKDLFLNIRVQPSSQLDHLEEVLVVTKITEQPPDVKDLGPIRASDILAQRLPTVPDNQTAVDARGNAITTPGAPGSPAPNAAGTGTPSGTAAGAATHTAMPGAAPNRPAAATNPKPITGGSVTGTASTGTAARPSTGSVKPGTTNSVSSATGAAPAVKKPAGTAPGTATQSPATGGASSGAGTTGDSSGGATKPKPRKPPEGNAPAPSQQPAVPPQVANPQR
jgi:rod shape-determining protein MreC